MITGSTGGTAAVTSIGSTGETAAVTAPIIGITASYGDGDEGALRAGRPMLLVSLAYVQAVEQAGGRALVLPLCPEGSAPEEVLELLDGLLVTGNDARLPRSLREQPSLPDLREQAPRRYQSDVAWIQGALRRRMPILCVCRGMQTLNEVLGGTLWPRLYPPEEMGRHSQLAPGHQPWHEVQVDPDSQLARALGKVSLWTNSFHVQGIREAGTGLRVSARALDGVVEAVEGTGGHFLIGVQFHPELQLETEPALAGLFRALVGAARAYRWERQARGTGQRPRRPSAGSAGCVS